MGSSRPFNVKDVMALSTLRMALRPSLLGSSQAILLKQTAPMSMTAQDQMKQFWKKNQKLQRPQSPWINYRWQLPMMTSLTNRVPGVSMTVGLYAISIGLFFSPDTIPHYVEMLKAMDHGALIWFPAKFVMAWPLTYHTLNSLRHLSWDFYGGYKVKHQLQTGWACFGGATVLASLLAGYAYI